MASLAQRQRGRRAMRHPPPRLPADCPSRGRIAARAGDFQHRPESQAALADQPPLRRPDPNHARHRPRLPCRRPQPTSHRPPARNDLSDRQTVRRRQDPGRAVPGPVARQAEQARRVQALPRRTMVRRLHQRLDTLGGDHGTGRGSYQTVRAYICPKRTSAQPVQPRPPSPRTVAGWILRHPDNLAEADHLQLKAVPAQCPELDALTNHVRSFAQMLTGREGERRPQWLEAVRRDDLPGLHALAAGLERDLDAVIAGLTLPWSSGAVEGHVNRIKMLKRQMYGRAGFDLLRKRVLLAG
ncbi:transposase [Kitasatospora paranensis]|uniref:Transposase n=1 Tax=Kitasatospora paranensis TaxID=258053 RepID=A0ABW2G4L3_9ACTN